jgi:YgiT-type zinc finger domain-containing protein
MKCHICRHDGTATGLAIVTLQRGRSTVVIKDVPACVCENCGEEHVDALTSDTLIHIAAHAADTGAEFQTRRYAD